MIYLYQLKNYNNMEKNKKINELEIIIKVLQETVKVQDEHIIYLQSVIEKYKEMMCQSISQTHKVIELAEFKLSTSNTY